MPGKPDPAIGTAPIANPNPGTRPKPIKFRSSRRRCRADREIIVALRVGTGDCTERTTGIIFRSIASRS